MAAEHIKHQLGVSDVVEISTIHERIWSIICSQKSALLGLHIEKLNSEVELLNSQLLINSEYEKYRALDASAQERFFQLMLENKKKYNIGLNDEYEEYAIHDYELPFEIHEYTPIEEVNRLCEMVEDLPEYIQEELSELQSYFGSIEELCEHEDDIICHSGCDDMADVARYYLEETGQLGELPAHLQNYIDYAAYGRDMELEGTFVVTNHGVYEIIR